MNIIEATKAAVEKGCCISRKATPNIKLKPTDICFEMYGIGGYVIKRNEKYERQPYWNPQTADVLANDWILTD